MVKQYLANHGKQRPMKLPWGLGKFSSTRFIFSRRSRLETNSQGLAAATVIAKVNGELWDLDRPFEKDSTLQLIKFDDEQGNSLLRDFPS